jgi:hypothetical protein
MVSVVIGGSNWPLVARQLGLGQAGPTSDHPTALPNFSIKQQIFSHFFRLIFWVLSTKNLFRHASGIF